MTRIAEVRYVTKIEHCGECPYAYEGYCEQTHTKIEVYWEGVLDNCPLEKVEDG